MTAFFKALFESPPPPLPRIDIKVLEGFEKREEELKDRVTEQFQQAKGTFCNQFPPEGAAYIKSLSGEELSITHLMLAEGLTDISQIAQRWLVSFMSTTLWQQRSPYRAGHSKENAFLGVTCMGMALAYGAKRVDAYTTPATEHSILPLKKFEPCQLEQAEAFHFQLDGDVKPQLKAAVEIQKAYEKHPLSDPLLVLPNIIAKHGLRIIHKFPDLRHEGKPHFHRKLLVHALKDFKEKTGDAESVLFLGHRGQKDKHSHWFALQIKAPFHFMDPPFGLITFKTFKAFQFGLACYLQSNYNTHTCLTLLECRKL